MTNRMTHDEVFELATWVAEALSEIDRCLVDAPGDVAKSLVTLRGYLVVCRDARHWGALHELRAQWEASHQAHALRPKVTGPAE
jgi:hypothetical protein